jgi:threonine/homoserine/homoserine lactone efflux protein
MTLELWLAYVLAAAIVLLVPGPTVLLVIGYALADGPRSAWRTVPGVMGGDATAVSFSLLGLGALLATSAALFGALKWIGAAYLVYLGVRLWRAPLPDAAAEAHAAAPRTDGRAGTSWAVTGHAYAVTALNPKGMAFFVAFLPQFLVPRAPLLPQALLLAGTWVAMAGLNATAYALLTGRLRTLLRRPGARRTLHRVSGGLLIGAGALTAALRRAA